MFVSTAFERAVPDTPTRKGYASQAVYGQLLLALIFDESSCDVRDRTLVASVQAVHATFGAALGSLDERLARQLQAPRWIAVLAILGIAYDSVLGHVYGISRHAALFLTETCDVLYCFP